MKLYDAPLNRYSWSSKYLNEHVKDNALVFDIGARDAIIRNTIHVPIRYHGYDLEPLISGVEKWDLDEPLSNVREKADYVLLLDVVEHLNNPWNCLKNLSDVTKSGGILVLTTPNPYHSNARFTLFASNWMPCFSESDLILNHHVFTPWPHILQALLRDNGFEIKEMVILDGRTVLFDKLLLKNPFRIFKRLLKIFMEIRNVQARGMSYGVIAIKK